MIYTVLDERLSAAAEMFPACDLGADIGADHGRLSCYLIESQKVSHMLVTDISDYSLEKARIRFKERGLEAYADFIVADGLDALDRKVEAAAILGMGGQTVSDIITTHTEKLRGAKLILSAHTDLPLLRQSVASIGYHLTDERVVFCRGRFYVVLKAEAGECVLNEREAFMGPCLIKKDADDVYKAYLTKRLGIVSCMRIDEAEMYRQYILEELNRVDSDKSIDS